MKKLLSMAAMAVLSLLCASFNAAAQDSYLVLHYTFEDVEGDTVKDASVSGIDAKLMGGTTIDNLGTLKVLKLGTETSYLDMTPKAGELLGSLGDFTVSVYYRSNVNPRFPGYGYFVWMFSTEEACGPETGRYFAYRINEQRVETSVGGYNHESIIMKGEKSETERWIHVLYTQKSGNGTLYINGKKVGENAQMPLMKTNFEQKPAYNWLGRPAFKGDNYLHHSYIADFRIYECSLDSDQVERLAANVAILNSLE